MKINLKNYLEERDSQRDRKGKPGPVVTLSRQYGCDAIPVAHALIRRLNERQGEHKWRLISKEIIEESASLLRISSNRIEERVINQALSTIEDMFSSLSHHYSLTDRKIVDTVKDIINHYAHDGHVVIVGRGGTSLTQHINQALHVRLIAPDDWRVKQITFDRDMTETHAYTLMEKIDHDRKLWSEHLSEIPFDDGLFDIILNNKTLTSIEIVDIILQLMADRNMIRSEEAVSVLT